MKKFALTERISEKYLKKLFRKKTDIEDALKRLDNLTQAEAQMAAAQVLKATHAVDNTGRVRGVADIALGIDNRVVVIDEHVASVDERVAGVDAHVAGVDERVAGVDERVAGVDERVASVDDHVKKVDDQVKTVDDKLVQQDLRRWLSPSDPSTNHNIASNAHHKGTATWFFEGSTYKEWKSTASESLLWVHGKRVHLPHSAT